MKVVLILTLLLVGCKSRPSTNPIEETARKTGVSIYKTVEGETYRWLDSEVIGVTREILP